MPLTLTLPALNTFSIAPEVTSSTTIALFSCSVTAALPAALIATYSGSGSVGSTTPAAVNAGSAEPSALVKATFVAVQSATAPVRSSVWTKPAGNCGRSPFLRPSGANSSYRSFSIAMMPSRPSLLRAIESGWPPRSMLRTRLASEMRTTSNRPDGLA